MNTDDLFHRVFDDAVSPLVAAYALSKVIFYFTFCKDSSQINNVNCLTEFPRGMIELIEGTFVRIPVIHFKNFLTIRISLLVGC